MSRECLALLMLALAGCAHRTAVVAPATPSHDETFLQLKEGYRLRVITPLTRSGSFRVDTVATGPSAPGETITLRTNDDFLGYEAAYYSVDAQSGGVAVRFLNAEQTVDGQTTVQQNSKVNLFQMPRQLRHVRLIYLIRQSESDHDMAIISADTKQHLEQLTAAVRAKGQVCKSGRQQHCVWVPAGIAVRAEMRDAGGNWIPVR
jgi:hypothetical protein